jgi:hypothetical protein
MVSKRVTLVLALLTIAALLLTACGSTPVMPGDESESESDGFFVALPRATIEVGESGAAESIIGIPNEILSGLMGGSPQLMDPAMVANMQASNIQHIELVSGKDGLFVFVNGQALPYLRWEGSRLRDSLPVIQQLNSLYGQLTGQQLADWIPNMLPLLQRVGMDVLIQLPVAEGAEAVEVRADDAALPEPQDMEAAAGDPQGAVAYLPIFYDASGAPQVMGPGGQLWRLDPQMLVAMGMGNLPLFLSQDTLNTLMQAGVKSVGIESSGPGIQIAVNGDELPIMVGWGQDELNNVVKLLEGTGMVDPAAVQLLNAVVPAIPAADVSLYMEFPAAEGQ